MPSTTDAVLPCVADDVCMPNIWIILVVAVGAINVRLMLPVVRAFFA
jgi:hypothetical protein